MTKLGEASVDLTADPFDLRRGFADAAEAAERVGRTITASAARMERSIEGSMSRAGEAATRMGSRIQDVGARLSVALTLPLLAMGAGALKAAMDFDLAMTGVAKTVDAPAAAIARMGRELQDLSETMPMTAVELASVAESAGQLGVGAADIVKFTKVMADLGVATDLSANDAATSIARFANITGMSLDDVDRLGSTIVALGNAGASTEREIAEMGLRLAGAGSQIGLSQSDILAFASALSSVGIEAEAGGSAFSKVFIDIASDVATGKGNLAQFAKIAGMSTKEFSTAFRTDAAGAVIAFIQGLAKMDSTSGETLLALEALGIKETRMRDALLRATGAADMFTESIKVGSDAWRENTALTIEAEKFYGAASNQLKALWNEAVNVAGTFGTQMLPALDLAIGAAKGILGGLKDLDPVLMNLVIGFGAAAAALGTLLVVVGTYIKLLPFFQANMALIFGVGGPILLGVAAFGALVAAGLALIQNWKVISYEAGQLVEKVTGPFKRMYDKIVGHSYVPDLIEGIEKQFGRLGTVMVTPAEKAARAVAAAFKRELAGLNSDVKEAVDQVDVMMELWERKARQRAERGQMAAAHSALELPIIAARKAQAAESERLHGGPARDGRFGQMGVLPFGTSLTPQAKPGTGGGGSDLMGKAGDALKSLGSAIGGVLSALNPWQFLLEAIQRALGDFIVSMTPIVEILAAALMPILEALFPIFKMLAIATTYVGQLFFNVAGGIAKAVGWLIQAIGKAIDVLPFISGQPIIDAGKAMSNLGDGFIDAASSLATARGEIRGLEWQTGKAAEEMGKLRNIPAWFRMQRARFDAALPGGTVPSGAGGGRAPVQDNSLRVGTMNVSIAPAAGESGEAILARVGAAAKQARSSGRTTELDILYAPSGAL